jgi:NAD(P)-dependent dehydrogenase (short-subunit alcohol dehydrogenase family)
VLVNDPGVGLRGEAEPDAAPGSPADDVAAAILGAGGVAIADHSSVTSWDACGALVARAVDEFGRLDVVVNNAGILRDRMIVSTTEEEWDAVIKVTLKGHFAPMRHAAAYWRELAKTGETVDARIVNTSSGAGLMGSVGQGNYGAAKAGIAALTVIAAVELARYNVNVNAIAPSARTRLTEGVFNDMMAEVAEGFDAMAPENISPLVVWLGSADSKDVTGRVFEVEGGKISVADGWQHGEPIDKGDRWEPAEVGGAVRKLLAKAPAPAPVYGVS